MNTQFLAKALASEFCTDNWGGVYRALYKGTDCGVTVGVTLGEHVKVYREVERKWIKRWNKKLGGGEFGIPKDLFTPHWDIKKKTVILEPGTNLYCDDLYDIPLTTKVDSIHVSSIIEGVDECTDTEVIELDKFTRSRDVIRAIYKACDSVERQAEEIWKRTHGCLTCAKHWDGDTPDDQSELTEDTMNWGDTPVWSDCPDCGGSGAVI